MNNTKSKSRPVVSEDVLKVLKRADDVLRDLSNSNSANFERDDLLDKTSLAVSSLFTENEKKRLFDNTEIAEACKHALAKRNTKLEAQTEEDTQLTPEDRIILDKVKKDIIGVLFEDFRAE